MRPNPLVVFLIALTVVGCRPNTKTWDTNIVAPLIQADLTLDDVLGEYLISSGDSSYLLKYNYAYTIDSVTSYLEVPDTLDKARITLDKLVLEDKTYIDTFTLREMDPTIGLLDGRTVDLPAQTIDNPQGEQELDVSEAFFQTAKFKKGFLELTINNDLPVYVDEIIFKLANKVDGSIIVLDTFKNIAPNTTGTKTIDLSGKLVDGVLLGSLVKVKTRASSGPVLIDADKGVRLGLRVYGLEPEYATAIFPEQTLVEDKQEVTYDFGDAQITELKAKRATVRMKITSTIQEEIIIDYTFPNSGQNGDFSKPFTKQYRVPAAPKGEQQVIEQEFPLDGFVIQYKGKDPSNPPFVNTIYSELTAKTVYSGEVRDISLEDFVEIEFGLVDVEPEYAFGDFGLKQYSVEENEVIPFMRQISGEVDLKDVSMNLTFENAFGIEILTTVNSIVGTNRQSGKSVELTQNQLIGQDIMLYRATNPPLRPFVDQYQFDAGNSNLTEFIENLPNQLETNIKLISRPFGSADYTDFVKDKSFLSATLDITMPVEFAANNLQLVQKQAFELNDLAESDNVTSGTIKLKVENDFPLDLGLKLEFLTEDDVVLLTVFEDQTVEAADLDINTLKTLGSKPSLLTATLNEQEIDLLREATKVRYTAIMDSPTGKRAPIYDYYHLKTKLIGDFIYTQNL